MGVLTDLTAPEIGACDMRLQLAGTTCVHQGGDDEPAAWQAGRQLHGARPAGCYELTGLSAEAERLAQWAALQHLTWLVSGCRAVREGSSIPTCVVVLTGCLHHGSAAAILHAYLDTDVCNRLLCLSHHGRHAAATKECWPKTSEHAVFVPQEASIKCDMQPPSLPAGAPVWLLPHRLP